MSTTQIKRLFQSNTEFVPITLAEAVVVNTSNVPGLSSLGITTLDKVLRTTLGVIGTNSGDIASLEKAVEEINTALEKSKTNLQQELVLPLLQKESLVLLVTWSFIRQLLLFLPLLKIALTLYIQFQILLQYLRIYFPNIYVYMKLPSRNIFGKKQEKFRRMQTYLDM